MKTIRVLVLFVMGASAFCWVRARWRVEFGVRVRRLVARWC